MLMHTTKLPTTDVRPPGTDCKVSGKVGFTGALECEDGDENSPDNRKVGTLCKFGGRKGGVGGFACFDSNKATKATKPDNRPLGTACKVSGKSGSPDCDDGDKNSPDNRDSGTACRVSGFKDFSRGGECVD